MNWSRRRFLRHGFATITVVAAGGTYARYIEPEWLHVDQIQIPLPQTRLQQPLKLLHLSDLHASPAVDFDYLLTAIRTGLRFQPDFICLTGDYITAGAPFSDTDREKLRDLFKQLASAAPTFASLGNHDGGLWAARRGGLSDVKRMSQLLESTGVHCLVNDQVKYEVGSQAIHLVGLSDLWAGNFQQIKPNTLTTWTYLHRAVLSGDDPIVVLSHNPDTANYVQDCRWDVMLCGHTHGGQVRIPLVGAPFVPVEDKQLIDGLHTRGSHRIYITRGVGNMYGIRVNCRPQIGIIELVPAQN